MEYTKLELLQWVFSGEPWISQVMLSLFSRFFFFFFSLRSIFLNHFFYFFLCCFWLLISWVKLKVWALSKTQVLILNLSNSFCERAMSVGWTSDFSSDFFVFIFLPSWECNESVTYRKRLRVEVRVMVRYSWVCE